MNYYNEIDPHAAAWLRNLISQNLIPAGVVDERSITEIKPNELKQYTQCHFFAGIGGWSLALQLAGWPATRPVWTGSCPCQPFSSAGKQLGTADERHLWPVFFNLIRECRPECVFGEQVASAIGKGWLDGVSSDLEGAGYACGAAVLGAHSVGAPHIRQRLFWMADATGGQREQCLRSQRDVLQRPADDGATGGVADATLDRFDKQRRDAGCPRDAGSAGRDESLYGGSDSGLADPIGTRLGRRDERGLGTDREQVAQQEDGANTANQSGDGREDDGAGWVGDSQQSGLEGFGGAGSGINQPGREQAGAVGSTQPASDVSHWSDYTLIPCADGKARRIESGLAPLVNGLPRGVVHSCDPREPRHAENTAEARVMRLRGYGNAIVPQLAALFVMSFTDESK